ncbi:MAG: L-threonylcarbamoyladenylate synthase [Pirellulales bacterium]
MPSTQVTDDLNLASEWLRGGKLVAFPTETVYGLGVDATNSAAVEQLFIAKGRPSDNPLIVHIADCESWPVAARSLSPIARRLLEAFSPGPLTVVVPKSESISSLVTADLDSVGIRIPAHEQARELLRLTGKPIAAPSANRSGRPSCTTWRAVLEDMDGRIEGIVRGETCRVGLESTVVECLTDLPVVLRAGSVTLEQIQQIEPSAISVEQLRDIDSRTKASPGTRHAHYQPSAKVILFEHLGELKVLSVDEQRNSALALLTRSSEDTSQCIDFGMLVAYPNLESYAQGFYELLREADRRRLRQIFLQLAPEIAQGTALRDRQLRAAGRSS